MPRIAMISDTHGVHGLLNLKPCDLLLVAGDYSHVPIEEDLLSFLTWIRSQHQGEVILIAGNHDRFIWKNPVLFHKYMNNFGIRYLENSSTQVFGLSIWGSPVTPPVLTGLSRRFELTEDLRIPIWNSIPEGTDIVITHCPPFDILDEGEAQRLGCHFLRETILNIRPRLHVFGHIHESYGQTIYHDITFVNAAMQKTYSDGQQVNEPIYMHLD